MSKNRERISVYSVTKELKKSRLEGVVAILWYAPSLPIGSCRWVIWGDYPVSIYPSEKIVSICMVIIASIVSWKVGCLLTLSSNLYLPLLHPYYLGTHPYPEGSTRCGICPNLNFAIVHILATAFCKASTMYSVASSYL